MEVISEIQDSGEIPDDFSRSIFMMLPKNTGVNKYELHQTNSLISLITKEIIRIQMNRETKQIDRT